MASVTMMASFLGGASVAHRPSVGQQRSLVVARATVRAESQDLAKPNVDVDEKISGRRAAMLAAAAAAAISVVGHGIALAEEPKRGTPEARKAYAPICVTMPTARVCHKIA